MQLLLRNLKTINEEKKMKIFFIFLITIILSGCFSQPESSSRYEREKEEWVNDQYYKLVSSLYDETDEFEGIRYIGERIGSSAFVYEGGNTSISIILNVIIDLNTQEIFPALIVYFDSKIYPTFNCSKIAILLGDEIFEYNISDRNYQEGKFSYNINVIRESVHTFLEPNVAIEFKNTSKIKFKFYGDNETILYELENTDLMLLRKYIKYLQKENILN
jgi:hypothetical protein